MRFGGHRANRSFKEARAELTGKQNAIKRQVLHAIETLHYVGSHGKE